MSTARDYLQNPTTIITRPYGAVKRLFLTPDEFFRGVAGDDGILTEFVIVLLVGIVGFLPMVYVIQTIQDPFGAQLFSAEGAALPPGVQLALWGRAFQILFGGILFWIAYAAVFLCTSWLWNGNGGFYDLLKVTSWGMIPIGVGNLIYFGVLAVAFAIVEPAEEIKGFGQEQIVQYLINQGATEWYSIAAFVILIVTVLWAGYLFAYAVKHARSLSEEEARKAVVAPVALHALYLVYTLLQHTIWFPDL